ncbi:MAG TPA: SPOR domain-containing protein [Candidatus Omnitrophota bacterium]|nr:SPOR domain-containing protein [Candidatus Omnitrophota bacterium]
MKRGIVTALFLAVSCCQLPAYGENGRQGFEVVEKMFLQDRYEEAIVAADRLIMEGSCRSGELYYIKGLSELKIGHYDRARDSFNSVLCGRADSSKKFDAYMGIGDSYFLESEFDLAVKTYEGMLVSFPDDRNRAAVYYRLSDCYAGKGDAGKMQYYFDSGRLVAPLAFEANRMPIVRGSRKIDEKKSDKITPPTTDAAEKYTDTRRISIQVGSFKSKANAENFASKLDGQGFDSHTETALVDGGDVYRVRVGKFSSKDETRDTIARLKNRGYTVKICDDDVCE